MLFVIYCIDSPGMESTRAATMQAHRDYMATGPIRIMMSGPLTSDDGTTTIGSLFLVDAPDRAAVERFQHNDPLYRSGIWATCAVSAFAKRIDNR